MICQENKKKQQRKGMIFAGSSRLKGMVDGSTKQKHVKETRKFSDHFGVFEGRTPSEFNPSGIVH
jgi:hypothetical protein